MPSHFLKQMSIRGWAVLFIRLTRMMPRGPMESRGPSLDQGQAASCTGVEDGSAVGPPAYMKA